MEYEVFLKEFSDLLGKMNDAVSELKKQEASAKEHKSTTVSAPVKREPVEPMPKQTKPVAPEHKYITIQVDKGDPSTAAVVCNSAFVGEDANTYATFAMAYAMARLISKDTGGNESDVEDIYDDITGAMAGYSVRKLMDIFKAVI